MIPVLLDLGAEIERLYNTDMTAAEVGKRLSVSESTVFRHLAVRGVPRRPPGRRSRRWYDHPRVGQIIRSPGAGPGSDRTIVAVYPSFVEVAGQRVVKIRRSRLDRYQLRRDVAAAGCSSSCDRGRRRGDRIPESGSDVDAGEESRWL